MIVTLSAFLLRADGIQLAVWPRKPSSVRAAAGRELRHPSGIFRHPDLLPDPGCGVGKPESVEAGVGPAAGILNGDMEIPQSAAP